MGTNVQWESSRKTLLKIRDSIYQYDMWKAISDPDAANDFAESVKQPSLDILIQICSFFQCYRVLEQTMFVLDPRSQNLPTFQYDIFAPQKRFSSPTPQ